MITVGGGQHKFEVQSEGRSGVSVKVFERKNGPEAPLNPWKLVAFFNLSDFERKALKAVL